MGGGGSVEHTLQDSKESDADIHTQQVRLSIGSTDIEPDAAVNSVREARISAHSSLLDESRSSLANRSVVESEDEPSPSVEVDVLTSTNAEPHDGLSDGTSESACMSGSESQDDELQAKRARVSDDEDSEELCLESSAKKVEPDDDNVELAIQSSDEEQGALQENPFSSTEVHQLSPIPADVTDECAPIQANETAESSPLVSNNSAVTEQCTGTKRILVDNEPIFRVRRRLSGS